MRGRFRGGSGSDLDFALYLARCALWTKGPVPQYAPPHQEPGAGQGLGVSGRRAELSILSETAEKSLARDGPPCNPAVVPPFQMFWALGLRLTDLLNFPDVPFKQVGQPESRLAYSSGTQCCPSSDRSTCHFLWENGQFPTGLVDNDVVPVPANLTA